MIFWILAYLGGLLTILSPCILPVLPFVFSRAEGSFTKNGFPLLLGMVVTFAIFSSLAVVGGSWVVHANEWGRWLALGVLSVFALTLIFPSLSERVTHPLTRLGGRLNRGGQSESSFSHSFMLGIATGLLWAPCAGPILGLILTGAALKGTSVATTTLLIAYALGAATSLSAALFAGGKLLKHLKKYLGADIWVRRVLGSLVLLGVVAISLGWDRGVLTRISKVRTEGLEQNLLRRFSMNQPQNASSNEGLASEGELPEINGATEWLNSKPLTRKDLLGKVVLIDFWTYSCINCLRTLPFVEAWAEKYRESGLVVIGVHTPEFAFEKNVANVQNAVRELGLTYPIVIDSDFTVWKAFNNQYWPAHYFIDAQGKIRHHHFGEGEYEESEKIIRALLQERNGKSLATDTVKVKPVGVEAPSLSLAEGSPETYIGYERSKNRVAAQAPLKINQWSLDGQWKIQAEDAILLKAHGKVRFRFHARDLHLVMGPGSDGKPLRFTVQLDGARPGGNHGVDIDESGSGTVKDQRLYQLIRQKEGGEIQDRTFEIEFLDPGVQVFAFTFG